MQWRRGVVVGQLGDGIERGRRWDETGMAVG